MKMKKLSGILALSLLAVVLSVINVGAESYEFTPNPADLYDLEHGKVYLWGIDWEIPDNETITGAFLEIADLKNWREPVSDPNQLSIHLTNWTPGISDGDTTKVWSWDDSDSGLSDEFMRSAWDGWHHELETLVDENTTPRDYKYDFTSEDLALLIAYHSDEKTYSEDYGGYAARFGLGFDPDCHFYNNGIKLTIETGVQAVPEPGTMLLMGCGLLGLLGFRRKLRRS